MPLDIRLAVIVNPEMPLGLIANTVGAIAIGLGAKFPETGAHALRDLDGNAVDACSIIPLPILQASAETMRGILLKALSQPGERAIVPFAAFSRQLHSWEEDQAVFPTKRLAEEPLDGLGLAGPSKWIKSLTGSLKLLR